MRSSNKPPRHTHSVLALSFDADQTLWDFRGVQKRALRATAEAMIERGDIEAGGVDATRLQLVRDEVAENLRGQRHDLEQARHDSIRVFLERSGHPAPETAATELTRIFLDVRFGQIKLYPEVRDSLERLKRCYRLGLLTNGNSYPDRCGLPDTFDAVVMGPAHGFEKPDPRAFEMISQELDVELESIVHVGDECDDIDGANLAGAISVFINRDGSEPSFRDRAAHEIRDLVELEALLETL